MTLYGTFAVSRIPELEMGILKRRSAAMVEPPDPQKMLELLQRAAEELKSSKRDASAARAEMKSLRESTEEANARIAKLEQELQLATQRMQEEHDRAIEDERRRSAELEQHFVKENEKQQLMAQKILELRSKQKESEEQLQASGAMNIELRAALVTQTASHARALEDAKSAQAQQEARISELISQLETATNEWHHTGKLYELLHREMLSVLDQRDDARRELEALKQKGETT